MANPHTEVDDANLEKLSMQPRVLHCMRLASAALVLAVSCAQEGVEEVEVDLSIFSVPNTQNFLPQFSNLFCVPDFLCSFDGWSSLCGNFPGWHGKSETFLLFTSEFLLLYSLFRDLS